MPTGNSASRPAGHYRGHRVDRRGRDLAHLGRRGVARPLCRRGVVRPLCRRGVVRPLCRRCAHRLGRYLGRRRNLRPWRRGDRRCG
ncbi:MAG: hypothetical protein BJ554DRAFT_6656, partial [Olpidium bornovanus]